MSKRLSYAELQQLANKNQVERAQQLQARQDELAKAATEREERKKAEEAAKRSAKKKSTHRPTYAEIQEQAKRNAAQKDVRVTSSR